MNSKQIISLLPYQDPFLFVDRLTAISEEGVSGTYTFKTDEYFYQGHFKDNPVTPGVILTEAMAQIGVVCLGIYLSREMIVSETIPQIALTSSAIDYYLPVYPGEKITVISEKEYYRFQKIKCKVKMINEFDQLVCRGFISGMVQPLAEKPLN